MLALGHLRSITNFRNAVDYMRELNVLSDEQMGELSGYGLLPGNQKEQLVGVPFLIIEYSFKTGRDNSQFAECSIITTNDQRYTLRDSSKGIYAQLRALYDERFANGHPYPNLCHYVRKGLTFQDFSYTTTSGEVVKPRTYYIS